MEPESCCENMDNRTEPEAVEDKPGLTISRCKVCGNRHFELTVDPGILGFRGAAL